MGFSINFGDLVDKIETAAGQQAVVSASNLIKTSGNSQVDHIPAQNQTVAAFTNILDRVLAKTMTAADAAKEINKWDQSFLLFTTNIGSARALRGGAEVHALAQNILASLGVPPGSTTPIVGVSNDSPIGGSVKIAGADVPTVILIGGGLLLGYLFSRQSRAY